MYIRKDQIVLWLCFIVLVATFTALFGCVSNTKSGGEPNDHKYRLGYDPNVVSYETGK